MSKKTIPFEERGPEIDERVEALLERMTFEEKVGQMVQIHDEVVQLYVRDLVGGVTLPVKELKGFRRISLAPGQSQRVRFEVPVGTLGFHGPDMRYVVEPGEFRLWIGPHAAEGLAGTFEVVD